MTSQEDKSLRSGAYILLDALLALGVLVIAMITIASLIDLTSRALNEDRDLSRVSADMRSLALQLARSPQLAPGNYTEKINGDSYRIQISRDDTGALEKFDIKIEAPGGATMETKAVPILFRNL